jgi:hypothetical protein
MMVGCYTLDLYCDNSSDDFHEDRARGHPYGAFPKQYTGRTEARCIRAARRDGWLISRKRVICPVCTKRNPSYFKNSE